MRCCPKQQARKITRSIHGDARDVARVAGTEAFEQACHDRTRNRHVVAYLRRSLRLGRLRLRGAQDEFTLAATAQNLPVSPSSLPDRRHSPWRALRKRHLRSVDASTPKLFASASANQRPRNGLADRFGTAVRRLMRRNLPKAAMDCAATVID